MTFASQYRMPGTYFEPQPGGVHPGVFRPPEPPSASSSLHLARCTGSYYSEATTPLAQVKRKRRTDLSRDVTPLHDWCDGNMNLDSSHETPQPNRQARYTLAGQLETPGTAAAQPPFENGALDESIYSDADYRRQLGSKRPHQEMMESPVSSQPTMLVQPMQPIAEGWSRFAFNTIGGVVGKVWEFCKAGAFRGFSAGGGKAYTIDGQALPDTEFEFESEPKPQPEPELEPVSPTEFCEKTSGVAQESTMYDGPAIENTPPGGFPQPDYNYAPFEHGLQEFITPETTPSRPAVKRRQTSAGNHDELRNWVVVDEPHAAPGGGSGSGSGSGRRSLPRAVPRPASRSSRPSMVPGRRISVPKPRLSATPTVVRRATSNHSTISHAGTPFQSSREPASFAGFRSPETPVQFTGPSPSRIPVPIQPAGMSPNPFAKPSNPATRQSGIPSPAQPTTSPQSHRRSQSSASAASARPKSSKEFGVESIRASPRLDAEAKRLAARRARDEQDSDALIDDFNQRLKEMIRQGREALGTKIEIDGDDGGWMDD